MTTGSRPGRFSCLLVLVLLLVLPASAYCQQYSLFLLGNFEQSLALSYDYAGRNDSYAQGRTNTSSQHRFEETYHIALPYAILSPRILKGSLALDFGFNQGFFSNSGSPSGSDSRLDFQYRIDGLLLDRTGTPARFAYSSTISHVQQEFSSGYDLLTDVRSLGFSIKNKRVPVVANYTETSNTTSGLPQDTVQHNRNFFIGANNKWKEFSNTQGIISFTDSSSSIQGSDLAPTSGRSYNMSFSNALSWGGSGKEKQFSTQYNYLGSAGLFTQTSSGLGLSYSQALGRALHYGVGYQNSTAESQGNHSNTNSGNAWVEQKLFENLLTRIDVNAHKDDASNGTEQEVTGTLNIAYQKKLPRDSSCGITYQQQIDVLDRNFTTATAPADETLTVDSFNGNLLKFSFVDQASIVVHNPEKISVPYVAGTDYFLEPVGNRTRLTFIGSPSISGGDKLQVTYNYTVNPSISFETDSRAVGASLSLFRSRYNLRGSYSESQQHLLSGEADSLRLEKQKSYTLGADTRWDRASLSLNYNLSQSSQTQQQGVEGTATHDRDFAAGTATFQVRDSYTTAQREGVDLGGGTETTSANTFNLGASFKTVLFGNIATLLRTSYTHTGGSGASRDFYNLGVNMNTSYRRFVITLRSQLNWQSLVDYTTRSESVRLDITRFF
ncbi:MAG TPA: hypothetical protein VIK40_03695 [Geomonas sp.]